jgi:hypothetical protein
MPSTLASVHARGVIALHSQSTASAYTQANRPDWVTSGTERKKLRRAARTQALTATHTPASFSLISMFSLAIVATLFLLVRAEQEIVCTGMTTEQKTSAIRSILTNHEDNVAARKAANVRAGLDAIVIEAMNTALKDDLAPIFACKPVTFGNG